MTDIPVGSPPVPPGRHAAPGGWYPDPLDVRKERYWDGWQWSKNLRDVEGAAGGSPQPGLYAQPYQGYSGQPPSGQYPGQQPQTPQDGQGQYPPDAYGQGQYPPNPYGQGQYPQDASGQQGQSAPNPGQQGQYPPNPYGQGQYPPNPYNQGQYPQNPYGQPAYNPNLPGQKAVATADGVRLAGWWWRALAVVLDSIIVGVIAAIPGLGIYSRLFSAVSVQFREAMRAAEAGQPAPVPLGTDLISASDSATLVIIGVVVAFAYHLLFVRYKSATPGKMICGLRIVPVDQGHFSGRLPWSTVLIRVAIWVLPKVNPYLLILRIADMVFPLWQPKRQALHDLAAKTQVTRKG